MATDQLTHDKRLKHFKRLLKAYRVRAQSGRRIVKRLGGKSRSLNDKDEAIEAAKKKAALKRVGVLVFESGHVSEVS
jgi:hypothetical protein